MSEYRQLQMKKAEEPDYLQHPTKIVAEVQATCRSPHKLVRLKSPLQKHKQSNMSTKVLSKTYIRTYLICICIKKVVWGLVAASQL